MRLYVSTKSEIPIYEQLYTQFITQILAGTLQADQCLPSIRLVARELNISVIPVKAAYEKLEKDGYIYTMQGKGCFVAPLSAKERQMQLAREKLCETVQYCRALGLSDEEIKDILENDKKEILHNR